MIFHQNLPKLGLLKLCFCPQRRPVRNPNVFLFCKLIKHCSLSLQAAALLITMLMNNGETMLPLPCWGWPHPLHLQHLIPSWSVRQEVPLDLPSPDVEAVDSCALQCCTAPTVLVVSGNRQTCRFLSFLGGPLFSIHRFTVKRWYLYQRPLSERQEFTLDAFPVRQKCLLHPTPVLSAHLSVFRCDPWTLSL